MTILSDVRIDAPTSIDLAPLLAEMAASGFTVNQLGPQSGRAASTLTLPDGTALTMPGAGDPTRLYIALRTAHPVDVPPSITLPDGWVISTRADSIAVLGLWAGEEP